MDRVLSEEPANDCGETTPQQLAYLKQELIHRINANDGHIVIQTLIDMIEDIGIDRCWHENRATSYCIDWYLDNHLCLVVDLVEGE